MPKGDGPPTAGSETVPVEPKLLVEVDASRRFEASVCDHSNFWTWTPQSHPLV